uniref:G_PROTEIN_RECEP_F1_2 domain-containing protein n=1 Tax=Ascaris lumbricoides TaxID=6252 RepID=A0A0M3HXP3_ASCLU
MIFNLQMSIGIERFMAICTPMRMRRFSRRTSALLIVSVWVIAAMFASPYLMFHRVVIFKYAECVMLYVLPLILLTVLYSTMSRVLWGKTSHIANETQQASVLRVRRSVVKMLIISMLLYFICYSPIQGIHSISIIQESSIRDTSAV